MITTSLEMPKIGNPPTKIDFVTLYDYKLMFSKKKLLF